MLTVGCAVICLPLSQKYPLSILGCSSHNGVELGFYIERSVLRGDLPSLGCVFVFFPPKIAQMLPILKQTGEELMQQHKITLLMSPLPRRLCFKPCLFVVWLVCQQDYTKSTEQISRKLGWRMGLGPE